MNPACIPNGFRVGRIPSVKVGVRKSEQLIQETRGHQIIQLQCDVPWPITPREVLMDGIDVDDIDEQEFIIAKMRTLEADAQDLPSDFSIPPLEDNMERIAFDGAVLFRPFVLQTIPIMPVPAKPRLERLLLYPVML